MQLTFKLTEADLRAGYWEHRNLHPIRKWLFLIFPFFMSSCSVVGIYNSVINSQEYAIAGWAPVLAIGLIWIFGYWVLPRKTARRIFLTNPSMSAVQQMKIDEDGVQITSINFHSQMGWKTFAAWHEGRDYFSLYFSKLQYVVIPKRVMSQDEISEMSAIFSKHIPTRR
jgi:hypothetical protein